VRSRLLEGKGALSLTRRRLELLFRIGHAGSPENVLHGLAPAEPTRQRGAGADQRVGDRCIVPLSDLVGELRRDSTEGVVTV